jgi:hypothetical protein
MKNTTKKQKDVCAEDGCKKISQHYSTVNGCKTGHCLGHIEHYERNIFKAKRYEHKILNSVARDLDSKVTDRAQFDQKATKELKCRPDLLLHSKNKKDVVIVEVDEYFHRKYAHQDRERESRLRASLSFDKDGNKTRNVHIIRIVPMETIKKHRMVRKNSDGYVLEDNEYSDILKLANHKIHKRLIGKASTDDTIKITPLDYKKLKTPSMILLGETEKESIKNIKVFTDILSDPENWKYTYPKELWIRRSSDSPIRQVASPTSLNESPISYITRQMSPTSIPLVLGTRESLIRAITPKVKRSLSVSEMMKNLKLN